MGARVVVLGAGASYDAGYPLAAQMGKCLAAWINTLPSESEHHWCLQEIANTYGTLDNFETILADLMTCPDGSKAEALGGCRPYVLSGLKQAITEHFAAIRVAASTALYDGLAGVLQYDDAVITFNYDLEIERALSATAKWNVSTGYGFQIGEQPKASSVCVLKLHGSVNWRALIFDGISGGSFIAGTPGNSLGRRPVLCFRPDLEYLGAANFKDPLCPTQGEHGELHAMIMPALPKTFYFSTTYGRRECKPFWDKLWKRAKISIRDADELVIIGYSLSEGDKRARSLLLDTTNRDVRLSVCCREDTPRLVQLFRDHGFTNVTSGTPSFEDFLANAEL